MALTAQDALDPDNLAGVEELLEEFEKDHPPCAKHGPAREPVRFQLYVRLKNQWSIR